MFVCGRLGRRVIAWNLVALSGKNYCNFGYKRHTSDLFEEEESTFDPITLVSKIKYLTAIGSYDEAYSEFYRVQESENGSEITREGYHRILELTVKCRDVDRGFAIARFMVENGMKPDVTTYNYLIQLSGYNRYIEKASLLYQNMKKEGILPNETTYTSLVISFCLAEQFFFAAEFIRELSDQDMSTIPDNLSRKISNNQYWLQGIKEAMSKLEC